MQVFSQLTFGVFRLGGEYYILGLLVAFSIKTVREVLLVTMGDTGWVVRNFVIKVWLVGIIFFMWWVYCLNGGKECVLIIIIDCFFF